MRTIIYIIALLASIYAFAFVFDTALASASYQFRQAGPIPAAALRVMEFALRVVPVAVLALRVFIWFKRRKLRAPASFSGVPYVVACAALGLPVVAVGGYLLLSFTGQGRGLSGVPLGFLLILCAALALLAMPYVELRDWKAFLAEQRSKSRGQA